VRILCPATRHGYSSAHADCIKRGSGWRPFRVLLAASSDNKSSFLPFESPTSFNFPPFFRTLLNFSSALLFDYLRALINAYSVSLVSTILYEFWCHIPSVLEFFGPFLASDNIPTQPSCTVQYLSPFFPPTLLWSLHFLFTAASVRLTVWATMTKRHGKVIVAVCPPIYYLLPFGFPLHSCINILNKIPQCIYLCCGTVLVDTRQLLARIT